MTLLGALTDIIQKRGLGPYAYEERMPDRLHALLQKDGASNVIPKIIPKLARLLEGSAMSAACLCHERVALVHKLATEGSTFCGYRNIQMLLLATGAGSGETEQLTSISELQSTLR